MTSHKLHRFLSSLYGRPHLISRQAFQEVSSYLHSRNANLLDFKVEEEAPKKQSFDTSMGLGILTIRGALTYRTSGWEALCGGYSYEMLLDEVSEMIEAGIKTIVIDADSGGGECYGCFEATDEMRKMCDDNGVKLYGYVDGSACSAMYGILCACDEIVANPFADVGSIGVLIALINDSEHLKQEGYERIFVTDGTQKVPYAENGEFKKEFIEDLEKRVADLGNTFREHVSKYTGLSVKELKATNAKVYSAQDALSIGLVNKIQTRSEFISYVVEKHKGVSA